MNVKNGWKLFHAMLVMLSNQRIIQGHFIILYLTIYTTLMLILTTVWIVSDMSCYGVVYGVTLKKKIAIARICYRMKPWTWPG